MSTHSATYLIAIAIALFAPLTALRAYGSASAPLIATTLAGSALALLFYRLQSNRQPVRARRLAAGLIGATLSVAIVELVFRIAIAEPYPENLAPVLYIAKGLFALFAAGWGALAAIDNDEKFHLIIPFVDFRAQAHHNRSILLDASALQDPRLYDIASTGIFDKRLAVPKFIFEEQPTSVGIEEGAAKSKLRKSGEILRKLEELSHLDLRIVDDDAAGKDSLQRLLQLAGKMGADILTAERFRLQPATLEEVRIINLHTLASAFKPLTQAGETLSIKVQRYGKEIKQGVGYLEDGTMVVINGGGDYLGETIKAQVLSIKHTSSGRMIFCNALSTDHRFSSAHDDDEGALEQENDNAFAGAKSEYGESSQEH